MAKTDYMEIVKQLPMGRLLNDENQKMLALSLEKFDDGGMVMYYYGKADTLVFKSSLRKLGREYDVYGSPSYQTTHLPNERAIFIAKRDYKDRDFLTMMDALGKTIIDCYRKPIKQ